MNNTVNISFQSDLLIQIDTIAKEESRSRSELIREAARSYILIKNKWKKIFKTMDSHVSKLKLSPDDVEKEIKALKTRVR